MVTETVLVKGSAFSSQTRSNRSSALSTPGRARMSASRTPNSRAERSSGRPSLVAVWRKGSSSTPAALKTRASGGGLAAGQAPGPEDQLGEMERFCEVVVCSQAETTNAVARRARCRQHEDHDRFVAVRDHPANGVPMEPREVAVEHDDVVRVDVQLGRRLQSVIGHVDGHSLVSEPLRYDISQRPRVLDDQDSHARAPTAWRTGSGSSTTAHRPPVLRAWSSSVPP